MLHPGIDIWAVARPELERVWRRRRGPRALLKTLRRRVPEWIAAAPEMPALLHGFLAQATTGTLELRVASDDLRRLDRRSRQRQRSLVWLGIGVALTIGAFLTGLLAAPQPRWAGLPWMAWLAGLAALCAFAAARRQA
jgi:ubiquinone biosynthesis protein